MHPFDRFDRLVRDDAELASYLQDLAGDALGGEELETPQRYISGAEVALVVAAYGVWSLLKIGVDHLRGLSEAVLAEKRAELVGDLHRDLGISPEKAEPVVTRIYKDIRERSSDDPILKKLLNIFSKVAGIGDSMHTE